MTTYGNGGRITVWILSFWGRKVWVYGVAIPIHWPREGRIDWVVLLQCTVLCSLLGRFASADTFVPEPGNLLAWDRYAYVYNSPIGNFDPTGHFTDDALYEYLLKLNKGDEEQAGRTLALWKVNKNWMGLLHDAEGGASLDEMIGDMLLVSSNGENGNMSVTGTQMYGVGQDYLEGLSGGNNLVDLFYGMEGAGTVRPNLGSESEIRNVFGNLHIRNQEYSDADNWINTITWGGLNGAFNFFTAPLIPISTVGQGIIATIAFGAAEKAMFDPAPEPGDTVITATSLDQSHSYQFSFVWSNNVELNYYDLQRYKLINWSNFK